MKYYTFHIDDSGAIQETEKKLVDGNWVPFCKIYDDEQFNSLNDILHSTNDYILNSKALKLFETHNIPPFELKRVKVLRKEKIKGFIRKYRTYEYFQLVFTYDRYNSKCYDWIDFGKSEIYSIDNTNNKEKIYSHSKTLELIKNNSPNSQKRYEIEESKLSGDLKEKELAKYKSYKFETKKIFFTKKFDNSIDLFKIPLYSWGVYISERLKDNLIKENITDIGFAESKNEIGKVWKPYFPNIEFEH